MWVGLVPQGRRVFASLTIEENLTVGVQSARGSTAWTLLRVYQQFPELKARRRDRASVLSGGQQSMLAIGRGLIVKGDLVIMDEPSEGLGPQLVSRLAAIIELLKEDGRAVLLVEQNLAVAASVSDQAYVLSRGKVAYTGPLQESWSMRTPRRTTSVASP